MLITSDSSFAVDEVEEDFDCNLPTTPSTLPQLSLGAWVPWLHLGPPSPWLHHGLSTHRSTLASHSLVSTMVCHSFGSTGLPCPSGSASVRHHPDFQVCGYASALHSFGSTGLLFPMVPSLPPAPPWSLNFSSISVPCACGSAMGLQTSSVILVLCLLGYTCPGSTLVDQSPGFP